MEKIENNTLFDSVTVSDSSNVTGIRGTNAEIYDYVLEMPVYYTTLLNFNFSYGDYITLQTVSSINFNHVIELFNTSNPSSYSWVSHAIGVPGNMSVTIPAAGDYIIRIRAFTQNTGGSVVLTVSTNGLSIYNKPSVVTGNGFRLTGNFFINKLHPVNFFTCKTINGGDPVLFLEDYSLGFPGKIKAWNDNYRTTSEGYSWGLNSRLSTSISTIGAVLVSASSSSSPSCTTDVYAGLQPCNINTFGPFSNFPNFKADNAFISGEFTGYELPSGSNPGYNCIDWSVGITAPEHTVVTGTWNFPSLSNVTEWDNFYYGYGYVPCFGADTINAAIALWKGFDTTIQDSVFTHASVRKNSTVPKPHGFEWESKNGPYERVMHTKYALKSDFPYGNIVRQYKPISGTVDYMPSPYSASRNSTFSTSDISQITALKNKLPETILSEFEKKNLEWRKARRRPELAIHSNPYKYSNAEEYKHLLNCCAKYGKAILPLLIDKLTDGDIFILNLFTDLMYDGNWSFIDYITPSVVVEPGKPVPSLYSNLVDYSKKILREEETNILNSIKNITSSEKGSFEVNVNVIDQEILLNIYSIKNEQAIVTIINVFGGIELEKNYSISKGNQIFTINASKFNKGIYVLQITIGNISVSQIISI